MPGACPIFDHVSTGKDSWRARSCPCKDRLRSVHSRVLESLFLLILLDHREPLPRREYSRRPSIDTNVRCYVISDTGSLGAVKIISSK